MALFGGRPGGPTRSTIELRRSGAVPSPAGFAATDADRQAWRRYRRTLARTGGLFLALTLLAGLWAGWEALADRALYISSAPHVAGRVSFSLHRRQGDLAGVVYTVGGHLYQETIGVSDQAKFPPGMPLDLVYDPSDPARVRAATNDSPPWTFPSIVAVVLLLVAAVFADQIWRVGGRSWRIVNGSRGAWQGTAAVLSSGRRNGTRLGLWRSPVARGAPDLVYRPALPIPYPPGRYFRVAVKGRGRRVVVRGPDGILWPVKKARRPSLLTRRRLAGLRPEPWQPPEPVWPELPAAPAAAPDMAAGPEASAAPAIPPDLVERLDQARRRRPRVRVIAAVVPVALMLLSAPIATWIAHARRGPCMSPPPLQPAPATGAAAMRLPAMPAEAVRYLTAAQVSGEYGSTAAPGLEGARDVSSVPARSDAAAFVFDSAGHAASWVGLRAVNMCADGFRAVTGLPAYAAAGRGHDRAGDSVDIAYVIRGPVAYRVEVDAASAAAADSQLTGLLDQMG